MGSSHPSQPSKGFDEHGKTPYSICMVKKKLGGDTLPIHAETNTPEFFSIHTVSNYELEQFTAIDEGHTEKETTVADLQHLNNHLAMCNGVLPQIKTIQSLCMISNTVCKLIETRRKVKKLPFGDPKGGGGQTIEILE